MFFYVVKMIILLIENTKDTDTEDNFSKLSLFFRNKICWAINLHQPKMKVYSLLYYIKKKIATAVYGRAESWNL